MPHMACRRRFFFFFAICWLAVGLATLMVQLRRFIDLDSAAFAAQSKSADDIIKSAKFPSAYAPGPDYPAVIQTDCWSFPISHAALGTVVTHDASVSTVSLLLP